MVSFLENLILFVGIFTIGMMAHESVHVLQLSFADGVEVENICFIGYNEGGKIDDHVQPDTIGWVAFNRPLTYERRGTLEFEASVANYSLWIAGYSWLIYKNKKDRKVGKKDGKDGKKHNS